MDGPSWRDERTDGIIISREDDKFSAFRIRIRKHSNIEILYYEIMENMELMEICGKLGKDFEKITKATGKKVLLELSLRELKKENCVN